MGSDRRFTAVLLAWAALLVATLAAFAATLTRSDLVAATLLAGLLAVGALAGLIRHVERTNIVLARFVEAIGHRDYTVRASERGGAGFDRIGRALNDAVRTLQADRSRDLEELRFWEAVVDDVPIALLLVDRLHGVRTINKLARQMFDRHPGAEPQDFAVYGPGMTAVLLDPEPVPYRLVVLDLAGGAQRAILRVAGLSRLGLRVRVVAIEPVQFTLDAAEVGAQTDLIRVLTHEILNSLTPITSLAGTAADLLAEKDPDIAEVRLAVGTLARRTEGMLRFIESYRAVARAPQPRRRIFAAAPFAAELARLFATEWTGHALRVEVDPAQMLDADPDLLAQAMINLLRNAAQATAGRNAPVVRLAIAASPGGGAQIDIEDNGAGVPDAVRADIFLPFFTTRADGSGVGLNLVRQTAIAHRGRVELRTGDLGGALFRLSGF